MHKRTARFIVILSLSIVLPLVIYLVYQLATIRKNEQIISSVYEDQLRTVLFSVNQYSNDYHTSLVESIESLDSSDNSASTQINKELKNIGYEFWGLQPLDDQGRYVAKSSNDFPIAEIGSFQERHLQQINQLINFKKEGYQKIDPTGMIGLENKDYQVIMVILDINDQSFLFIGLIEPLSFVAEVLSPKMQQIANQELVIFLKKNENPTILFSTDSLTQGLMVKAPLWLFPAFELGVSPKNITVKDLINNQRKTALLMIAVLFVMMGVGVILMIRNIRKEAQLNQAKSDFVSNVSHELRTPLALIRMFTETLLMGRNKNEAKKIEYLEIIFKETNRLTNIVNRILNFSRIEANRRVYHRIPIDLVALIHEVKRDYSYHLEQHGFELLTSISQESAQINADKEAIYEAMIILIDNAMKYSEEEKKITIELQSNEKQISLTIADLGIGIAQDKLDQVFDKFFRVSDNDQYIAQGAGLGLSILRHIMDAHEGKVSVESTIGKGSRFTLTFKNHGKTVSG